MIWFLFISWRSLLKVYKGKKSPYISFGYLVIMLCFYLPNIKKKGGGSLLNSWVSKVISVYCISPSTYKLIWRKDLSTHSSPKELGCFLLRDSATDSASPFWPYYCTVTTLFFFCECV